MKNKRENKRSPARFAGVFFASFFFMIGVFLGVSTTTVEAAGTAGLVLEFDESGTLVITTYGKKATSGIRYDTIGWTIKRYNAPIRTSNPSTRVAFDYAWEEADPNHAGYEYGHFIVSSSTIYNRIRAVSAEWAESLYQNGGVVYLDAILTVEEYGTPKGGMNSDGTTWGEVYFTYAGISTARAWARPQDLRNFFNHGVSFPAIRNAQGSSSATQTVINGRSPSELSNAGAYRVSSPTGFDPAQAIPSSEALTVSATLPAYSLSALITHRTGIRLVETGELDYAGNPIYEELSYAYDTLDELWGYELIGVTAKDSGVLGGGITLRQGTTSGSISLTAAAGSIWNSTGNWAYLTQQANANTGSISFYHTASIPGKTANGSYTITWQPVYRKVVYVSGGVWNYQYASTATVASETLATPRIATVKVHTPVASSLEVSDEKQWNQQYMPTEYTSLVLGRTFTVDPTAIGTHMNAPGYGRANYAKYASARQVRFPFDVIKEERVSAGTWITLTEETTFLLPDDVPEGDYVIESRSIAINSAGEESTFEESHANLSPEHTIATDRVEVNISGRLYGFTVTNVLDYPRWENVFSSGITFSGGASDENGQPKQTTALLPIGPGSHPEQENLMAVGLGYRIQFRFRTMGAYGQDAHTTVVPAFYLTDDSLQTRTRVDLYYERDGKLVKIGSAQDLLFEPETGALEPYSYGRVRLSEVSRTVEEDGQTWYGEYCLPAKVWAVAYGTDLSAYAQSKQGFLEMEDEVFLQDRYLIVQMEICAVRDGQPALLYGNFKNAAGGYCNMWRTEGFQTVRNELQFFYGDIVAFDRKLSRNTDYTAFGTE